MVQSKRPSAREIDQKLRQAEEALKESRGLFANPQKAVGELIDLDIGNTEELWPLVLKLLKEIKLIDYAGSHPPMKSYEPKIANCELYAFTWNSKAMDKRMYIKFAIKTENVCSQRKSENKKKFCFYYVSLHESKPNKGNLKL